MSDFARVQEENIALKEQIDRMWALMTKEQIKKLEKGENAKAEGADAK